MRPVRVATVHCAQAIRAEVFSGSVHAHVQADLGFRVGGKVVSTVALTRPPMIAAA